MAKIKISQPPDHSALGGKRQEEREREREREREGEGVRCILPSVC